MRHGPVRHTWPAIAVLFLLTGQFTGSDAEASQFHYRDVGLAEVVELSNLIVIAKPLKPFKTVKRVVLHAGGSRKSRKKTTFQGSRYHFSVVQVLKNTVSTGKVTRLPGTIEVTPADEGISRSIARAYLNGRPVPSPILLRYLTKVKLPEAGKERQELVLFLSWHPPARNPRFAVVSSYEQIGKLAEIKTLIRGPRKKAGGK
jgi:hypothetical protein